MRCDDRGSAVADFVMVSSLLVLLFAVVFQVGLALHARNVLVGLAAEGARYGANADVDSAAAVEARTRAGITGAFTSRYARRTDVQATLGPRLVEVRVTAPLPLAFVPGSPVTLSVRGRALEERRP